MKKQQKKECRFLNKIKGNDLSSSNVFSASFLAFGGQVSIKDSILDTGALVHRDICTAT